MDPYNTPLKIEQNKNGRLRVKDADFRCPNCGGSNLQIQRAFRSRPSLIGWLLFHWLYFIIGAAFRKEKKVCLDCGELYRFRTTGSNIAALILVCLVILSLLGFIFSSSEMEGDLDPLHLPHSD